MARDQSLAIFQISRNEGICSTVEDELTSPGWFVEEECGQVLAHYISYFSCLTIVQPILLRVDQEQID